MRRERINVGFISSISLFHIKLIKQRRFWYYLIEELPYLIILQNNVHKYLPMLSKSPFQMTLHAKRSIMRGQNRHALPTVTGISMGNCVLNAVVLYKASSVTQVPISSTGNSKLNNW